MTKKKVLIITYYWPPSGGSGVQRWLKFVKYLPDFGITPIVYTVKNPKYFIEDPTLESEVPEDVEILRKSIFEPNNIFSLLGKKSKQSAGFLEASKGWKDKILNYIRANYFIPDARKFWVRPSVRFLSAYLKNNPIDIVITTGPPHSTHLIGLGLKKKLGIKWISDFRDPWTSIDYFHRLPLTKRTLKKHKSLETNVIKHSDAVITISNFMKDEFLPLNDNIHVIPNGYDNNTKYVQLAEIKKDNKFTLVYVGLLNADRNPENLWRVLSEICLENPDFKRDLEIKLVGKACDQFYHNIESHELSNQLNDIGYVDHSEVSKHQRPAQVLLLLVNNVPAAKGVVTGKIFEYLISRRPILAIGPTDGDLAGILEKTNAGKIVDFNDDDALKSQIVEMYSQYRDGELEINSRNIEQYHRKNLTGKLVDIIKLMDK